MDREFVFRGVDFPVSNDLSAVFDFFCDSLGFNSDIAKKVFLFLILKSKYGKGASVEEISVEVGVSLNDVKRVVNELLLRGVVRSSRGLYLLRENSLSITVDSLFSELRGVVQNVKRASVLIDRKATKSGLLDLLDKWK